MRGVFAQTAGIAVIVFAVSSMVSVGLSHSVRSIVEPLREPRAVFRALVANFVLVPLWAVAIERAIPMEPPLALGLFLLAGSAGAPFLIKLTKAARGDLALSATLLMLLVPVTIIFLPFYVPLATAHPSLSGLTYVRGSVLGLGVPLLSTMLLPIAVGLVVKAVAPRWAAPLVPITATLATVALAVIVLASLLANARDVVRIFASGAIIGALALIVGAFAMGSMLSRRERSLVLGLGTAQRNIAAAMVVASRDFRDPDILVMVTVSSLTGLLVLFPIAWALSRRKPGIGPPTRPSLAPASAAA